MWSIQRHCGGIVLLQTHNLQAELHLFFTISAQRHRGGIVVVQWQLSQHDVVINLTLESTWVLREIGSKRASAVAVKFNMKSNEATFSKALFNSISLWFCNIRRLAIMYVYIGLFIYLLIWRNVTYKDVRCPTLTPHWYFKLKLCLVPNTFQRCMRLTPRPRDVLVLESVIHRMQLQNLLLNKSLWIVLLLNTKIWRF